MNGLLFYLLSLLFSLYVAYLATFCTYKTDGIYGEPTSGWYIHASCMCLSGWWLSFRWRTLLR